MRPETFSIGSTRQSRPIHGQSLTSDVSKLELFYTTLVEQFQSDDKKALPVRASSKTENEASQAKWYEMETQKTGAQALYRVNSLKLSAGRVERSSPKVPSGIILTRPLPTS